MDPITKNAHIGSLGLGGGGGGFTECLRKPNKNQTQSFTTIIQIK
jgi:hypothetical protein